MLVDQILWQPSADSLKSEKRVVGVCLHKSFFFSWWCRRLENGTMRKYWDDVENIELFFCVRFFCKFKCLYVSRLFLPFCFVFALNYVLAVMLKSVFFLLLECAVLFRQLSNGDGDSVPFTLFFLFTGWRWVLLTHKSSLQYGKPRIQSEENLCQLKTLKREATWEKKHGVTKRKPGTNL